MNDYVLLKKGKKISVKSYEQGHDSNRHDFNSQYINSQDFICNIENSLENSEAYPSSTDDDISDDYVSDDDSVSKDIPDQNISDDDLEDKSDNGLADESDDYLLDVEEMSDDDSISDDNVHNVHGKAPDGITCDIPNLNLARRVMRDTPLAELTFRKYEIPYEADTRELLRKFCLSIGLLQPGDSRDVIVDVLYVLLQAKKEKKQLSSDDIRSHVIDKRRSLNLPLIGVAGSNVRRQIKRLRDMFIVEKVKNEYMITEFLALEQTFTEKVESYLLPSIMGRLKEYLRSIDKRF
ncbi:hypothetical protein JXB31_04420 [Candidatus Woesearchaeota archaeon]|nr:hypothetical protein [Candidatus Woesearchaeota archaeon]